MPWSRTVSMLSMYTVLRGVIASFTSFSFISNAHYTGKGESNTLNIHEMHACTHACTHFYTVIARTCSGCKHTQQARTTAIPNKWQFLYIHISCRLRRPSVGIVGSEQAINEDNFKEAMCALSYSVLGTYLSVSGWGTHKRSVLLQLRFRGNSVRVNF